MAYNKLSTANLPDPVIDPAQGSSPEDYFNTVLYTGTGAAQDITGVGFEPDFTWLKIRSSADNHILYDRLRGTGVLYSNSTASERDDTSTDDFTFDSDGFAFTGGWNNINGSGSTYVGWNWKANGSGVSNTDGSITSTVSANTTSGFSIVSYTGNSTSNATVGHGLNLSPEVVLVKSRTTTDNWSFNGDGIGGLILGTNFLEFNSTNALLSNTNQVRAVSSSTFTLGTGGLVNTSPRNYIAYCFHSVEGFSKFGTYVANGSSDGPFVYTGFRPSFVVVKSSSYGNSETNWAMYDDARGYNEDNPQLFANRAWAEGQRDDNGGADIGQIDLLSNGFKLRDSFFSTNGSSGQTYIYMAFAENPFKYSNAR